MGRREIECDGGSHFGRGINNSSIIHAIVTWSEALNGKISLQEALVDLATGLGAEVATIVRTQLSDQKPVRIAACDLAKDAAGRRPLRRSFADAFFGAPILHARAASMWVASAHLDDATGDPSLQEWQAARRLKEFLVLIMAAGPNTRDHIELHFRDPLAPEAEALLQAMLPDMARVWSSRKVGLITRTMLNHRSNDQWEFRHATRVRILGSDNPLRLSRAEFRVCLLLSQGLVIQAVVRELGLSEPTIRTHLRNIYAKVSCGSLAELVFQLMESNTRQDSPSVRFA